MVECDYCGTECADEDAYHAHLASEHDPAELGPIDRRKAGVGEDAGEGGFPTGPVVLGAVLLFAVAILGYVLVGMGGGGDSGTVNGVDVEQMPGEFRSAHEHGAMNVTIAGERLDFSRDRYQVAADRFHFERGNGRVWHSHATGVTLQFALATLGMAANETSLTFEGTTYVDGENAEVEFLVDGESVDPTSYVLQGVAANNGAGGDRVRVVVTTN